MAARTRSIAFSHGRVLCGGSDGSVTARALRAPGDGGGGFFADGRGDDGDERGEVLAPSHGGSVASLAAIELDDDAFGAAGEAGGGAHRPQLFASGAHDGTVRVWDLAAPGEGGEPPAPRCLYALGGYKVWLGSVVSDGARLVADGTDNAVLLHDFAADPPPPEEGGETDEDE